MHEMELSENLLAVGRAGAGVNNIPLDKCAEKGIVVFNAPGANANAVKELLPDRHAAGGKKRPCRSGMGIHPRPEQKVSAKQ